MLSTDDVAASISDRTRVLAATWVNSFTGHAVDLDTTVDLCSGRDVAGVVNASQALGARPFGAASTMVDAVVSCGYKWLTASIPSAIGWSARLMDQVALPWWSSTPAMVRLGIATRNWPPPVSMSLIAKATFGSARTCSTTPEDIDRALEALHDEPRN